PGSRFAGGLRLRSGFVFFTIVQCAAFPAPDEGVFPFSISSISGGLRFPVAPPLADYSNSDHDPDLSGWNLSIIIPPYPTNPPAQRLSGVALAGRRRPGRRSGKRPHVS